MLSIEYSKAFDAARAGLLDSYGHTNPSGYEDLLVRTLDAVNAELPDYGVAKFDTDRIKSVSTGSYQGYQYWLIPADGYDEGAFTAYAGYGSCSHCDAFEAIRDSYDRYDDDGNEVGPDQEACEAYLRLSLHLFQSLKSVRGE